MDYESGAAYKQQQEDFVISLKRAYHIRNILPLLLKYFPGDKKIKVLEYGPGLGVMADILHDTYPDIDYSAVDIDEEVLQRIKNRYTTSQINKINSSQELSGFLSDKEFDLIISLDVWEHIPRAELNAYTKNSLKHLNAGGIFIAQVPNCGCPFTLNVIFAGDITHCNPFNEISARQLLIRNGADDKNIQILPYHFPQKGFLNLIRSILRPPALIAYKAFLGLLGLQVLSICTPNLIMLAQNNRTVTADQEE